jgi:hypothetical protein
MNKIRKKCSACKELSVIFCTGSPTLLYRLCYDCWIKMQDFIGIETHEAVERAEAKWVMENCGVSQNDKT